MNRNIYYTYITTLLLLLVVTTTTHAQTINGKIYGGGEKSLVDGDTKVQINSGTIGDGTSFDGGVFGGGLGETTIVSGNVEVFIGKDGSAKDVEGPTINGDVYGGSALGNTNCSTDKKATADKTTNVTLNAGTIKGSMYGGALGQKKGVGSATSDIAANVYGPVQVTVNGGKVLITDSNGQNGSGGVYGCNNLNGEPKSTVKVDVYGTNSHDANGTEYDYSDDNYAVFAVYGGGNQANYTIGTPVVTVHNCDNSIQYVYGGGNAAHLTNGDTDVTIWGGNRIGNVFGGGNGQVQAANISGGTNVKIYGGSIGDVFGGSNSQGTIGGQLSVEINSKAESDDSACQSNISNVYGGGNQANYSVFGYNDDGTVKTSGTRVAEDPILNIKGGYIVENVFGGGLQAQIVGNTHVNVTGGTVIKDVYGGGALADVTGNTTVNLTGGSVGGAYGGALGSAEVAAKVYGNTYVHLDRSQVTGTGIFGANNLNGTPTGHVKVHVTNTTPRDGFTYAVPAVYGGGNLSAYEPDDDNDYAEVLIEGCDNSIEYVYGGGNAAPVPATDVKIYGANAIGNVFAGGNGAGDGNPGADVGYLGYYSKGSHVVEYGSGTTYLTIYGGTVEKAYGGSNTLGYIREHATVELAEYPDDYEGITCDLHVGDVHGGGNHAEMFCDGTVILGCTEGAKAIYAGADNADINGNLEITITSGTFGQVFGGNNQGGCIRGSITVNIDETGCKPIYIGELYGCGDNAPYSVYGYNEDKTPKKNGEVLYKDPVVNLISFTKIGKVFGGGNGTEATVFGNPTVNINTIKGVFAGKTISKDVVPYIINNSDERVQNNDEAIVIPDEVGTIRNVYGGGNKAAVFGNTRLNIGTEATANHKSGNEELKAKTEDVSVFILGNVFGGSKGVSDDPAAGRVTGTTKVIIGE